MISDTHFHHKRIIEYADRPFANVLSMNKSIIENWNTIVSKDDKVFHLGDIGFGNTSDMYNIFRHLNGHKILIRGNHDKRFSDGALIKIGFKEIYKYPIILEETYILSHAPLEKNIGDMINIHGHIHDSIITNKNHYNACVEHHNYTPINFKEIKNILNKVNYEFKTSII